MVPAPARHRWLPVGLAVLALALAALAALPGAQAVRVLDSPDQLPDRVHAYGEAEVDDHAYLLGGGRGGAYLNEIATVRPDGTTSADGQLPQAVKSPAAASHDGEIYVFGGAKDAAQSDLPETTDAIVRYDPATDEAEQLIDVSLPDPVAGASAVTVGDTIYVLGGLSIQPSEENQVDYVDTIAAFDPTDESIREVDAQLPTGRAQASAVASGDDVLYVGGQAEAGPDTCPEGASTCFVGDVLRFNPERASVGQIGELPEPVRWSATALHEGTVYVLGGCRANCGAHEGTAAIQTVDADSGDTDELAVKMPVTGGRNDAMLHDDVAWMPGGVQATENGSADHDRILRVELGETRPWAPVNLTAEAVQGGVALDWEPPTYDGGAPVSAYVVERTRGAREPTRLDQVTDTRFRDLNATEGVSYTYQVRAQNAHGLSAPSGDVPVRPTRTPDPPAVSAQGGDGKLVVQWRPPEDTGGLEVTAYRVFAYGEGSDADVERCASACWGKVSNATTRASITSVQDAPVENGQTYEVRVQARNGNGWGSPSEAQSVQAKPVPDAPTDLEAQPTDDGERYVDLTWQAPGEDANGYVVYRGTSLDELTELGSTGETVFRDEGPIPEGRTVLYAVAARNGDAEGPISQPADVVFATPPREVDDLTARWTGGQVAVAWNAPNETGGEPVQRYEVARTRGVEDPEEANATIHRTVVERYQDGNPEKGTPLAYHVRAVTDAGPGPWSFEQVRVPHTQESRPPVPALAAHPAKIDAGERVVFDASGSDDDGDIVAYNFTFGDGEGTGWRSSPRVTYSYPEDGVYNASVQVRDTSGLQASAQATIAVGEPQDSGPDTTDPAFNGSGENVDDTENAPLPAAIVVASLLAAGSLARRRS